MHTPEKRPLFAAIFAGLLLATPFLMAQQPQYEPPPPPTKNTEVDIRIRYLLAPDVTFRGMGNIPFRESYTTDNNLLEGTERGISYDDGFLSQDYINQQLIEGSTANQQVVSPNTGATAFFAVASPEQLPEDDPTGILFHRYAAGNDPDVSFDADYSGSLNWEISYTRYLNSKRRLGIQVGFGVTGYDSTLREEINADLYVREFRHEMAQGDRPIMADPVENADGSTTQTPFIGDRARDDVDEGNLLDWAASEMSEETILEGAVVQSRADLRSSMYNFKVGPVYNARIMRSLSLQVGAGVSALYYNGLFGAYEILNNPVEGSPNPSRSLTTTEQNDWQVGGYVDANARYQLNNRVNFFSGVQLHTGSTYTQYNEEREVNVDFRSHVYIHAGFGVSF